MKLFVTGATGFLGHHVVREAVARGHSCVCTYRNKCPSDFDNTDGASWLRGDLSTDWSKHLGGVDAVLHLAAIGVSPKKASLHDCFHHNVTESLCLMENAIHSGVSQVIACGSCFEYGRSGERYEFIPVSAPLEPVNAYGASKAAATIGLSSLAREHRTSLTILRPFHFYGEGQHESNFWPALRKAAIEGRDFEMTAGDQVRDFCDVTVVAKKFLEALEKPALSGEPKLMNVGSGNPVRLRDFAASQWKIWNATGALHIGAIPYREGEVMRYVPEIDS